MLRDPGEVFLLRHTGGPDAVSWVERIDPITLETLAPLRRPPRRPDLARRASPRTRTARCTSCSATTRTASRPTSRCSPRASCRADCPYNSFVVAARRSPRDEGLRRRAARPGPGGARAAADRAARARSRVARRSSPGATLPEPSIARLSADGDDVYVVGTSTLFRVRWDGAGFALDDDVRGPLPHARGPDLRLGRGARARRRVVPRQRRGQRALRRHVPRAGHLDRAAAPRAGRPRDRGGDAHRDLRAPERHRREPARRRRGAAHRRRLRQRQRRARRVRHRRRRHARHRVGRATQNHACHPLLFPDTGELVTNDHDAGAHGRRDRRARHRDRRRAAPRRRRAARCSRWCSPPPGFGRDFYYCSFAAITRVSAGS